MFAFNCFQNCMKMGNGVVTPQRTSNSSQIINYEPIRKVFKIISSEIRWKKPINLRGRACLELVVIQLKNELSVNEVKITTLQRVLIETQKELQSRENEILELHKEIHKLKSVLQQSTVLPKKKTLFLPAIKEETRKTVRSGKKTKPITKLLNPKTKIKKQGVSAESSDHLGQICSTKITRHEKDYRSKQLIKDAIMENDFLKKLDTSQVLEIVEIMYPQEFTAGTYIIKEGEYGNHLYVSSEGQYEVIKRGHIIGKMGSGESFGELAILYNCTRTASIRAVTDCKVWVLDRKVFKQIMIRTGIQRIRDNIHFLKSVPLLQNLSKETLIKIVDAFKIEFFPPNTYIITQGTIGDTFFIIKRGTVKVTQKKSEDGEEEELRTLNEGDYFGEQSLLKEAFRSASVIALTPGVECLTLDREYFFYLRDDLTELQEKTYVADNAAGTENENEVSKVTEYDYIQLDELNVLATLGVGGFGRVDLVQYKHDKSLTFALKCMKKKHVVDTSQQEHVMNEKTILLACRSPFICRMFRTYKDNKYVYLLMEACLGGEVWTVMKKRRRFDDYTGRFITACVVEGFSYIHSKGIVYRDIKPENLLFDSRGYVKLVDFGFAKRLKKGRKTWTFCGTPEYVAPETILNKGHDRAVDYWGLGILIYELLTGRPPFVAKDPMKTYNLILKGIDVVQFSRYISRPAQSLIRHLCRENPAERLGYKRGGIKNIKIHRWFNGFPWESLHNMTMIPPITPIVTSSCDYSNFDCDIGPKVDPPDELSGWDIDF